MINYVGLKNKLTVDVTRALKATKNGGSRTQSICGICFTLYTKHFKIIKKN